MSFTEYLQAVKSSANLSRADAAECLGYVLDDETIPEADIADFLLALNELDITVDTVCGFLDAMKARMTTIQAPEGTIDTCGTGGDKSGTFNISTAAAIVLAAGGVYVAKHGNRAASSQCGSSDVLEALSIPINASPQMAEECLQKLRFTFLFAQRYHPALKRLGGIRRQLGQPTVFNLLGPLLNPAGVKRQVIGTFSLANAELIAQVVAKMDTEHVLVITSDDGLDEASLSSPVQVFEIQKDQIKHLVLRAEDYGLADAPRQELLGGDATENASIIVDTLSADTANAKQRIVAFNAGLGFYVAGNASTIQAGIELAQATIASGSAAKKLQELQP